MAIDLGSPVIPDLPFEPYDDDVRCADCNEWTECPCGCGWGWCDQEYEMTKYDYGC